MAATENTYTQSGSTTNYSFTFPYLKQSDVKVTVAGETVDFGTESNEWQFDNATTIKFNTAPTGGAAIRIYRDTSVDDLTATFYAGSAIKSQDLNDNFNQSLYVTQEAKRDIGAAWTSGDETVDSTEAWHTSDDKKIATTKAIQERLNLKQNSDTDLTNLSSCQTGGSSALAALTQTEIEILDGATVTTTELNYVDGVTSNIQTQLDARQDEDALLTAISGKDFKVSTDGDLSSVDTEIPSSKVVANHVSNSISAIGGFEAIADEDNFPATIPAAGVIVSIANATGIEVNNSGTSTTARTAGNGSDNVTINNFPAALTGGNGTNANPFPLPNNTGLLVISTGSNHTYNFHRLLPTTDDVKQLSDDVNDFFARYRIANSAPNSANDDGDLWWDTSTTESSGRKMQVYDSKYNNNDGTTGRWIDLVTSGEAFINTLSISSGTGGGTQGRSTVIDGSAYRFTLSNPGLTAQHHIVSRAGTIQKPNAGTSQPSEGFAIDGNDIIFGSEPPNGTSIFVITIGSALSIGTPSDNTVTNAKIVDDTIAEAKLDISNAPTDGKFLQYKDSTDKLTWEFADAHIELEADGDIADNHSVIVTSAGKAKEVTETITTANPPTILDPEVTNFSGAATNRIRVSYDPVKNYIFTAVGNDGDDLDIATYEWDNANSVLPNFTANVEIAGSGVGGTPSIASHPTNGYHFVVWTGSNVIRGRLFNFDNSGQALSGSDQVVTNATSNNIPESSNNIVYSPDDDKFLLIWTGGSGNDSDDISVSLLTPDYTNKTVASTSASVVFDDADNYEYDIFYDEYSNKVIAACWTGNYLKAKIGTIGSSSISWGSAVNIAGDGTAGNNGSWLTICGEPETGKMLFAWMQLDTSSNHHGKCKVVSVDGTGFSTGSETTFNNTSASSRNRLFYDPTIKKLVLVYKGVTGGVGMGRVLTVTISGTTPSFTSYVDITHSSASNDTGNNAEHLDMAYHPTLKKWCYVSRATNQSGSQAYTVNTTVYTGGATTNLSNSFVGFSDGSFTNGQIAKINVTGSTTTQSSLTTGSRYYVNEEGNLSLSGGTPNVVAGLAVSPTKLLIKAIPTDSNIEYSNFTSNADGLVPRSNATGDTDKYLKGDGSWSTPGMTLIDTLTIGNNSSYTTNFGANWWNTYKYIKLIYFGSYDNAGYTAGYTPIYFRHNSISTDDSYEIMELHHHNSSNNSDNELGYSDYSSGILAKFKSNGSKFHIDCEIYSDGTNTSFKSSVICSDGGRSGLFYTFLESAGSSFEFRQTLTNGSSGDSNRRHFPGTAKFYGIN